MRTRYLRSPATLAVAALAAFAIACGGDSYEPTSNDPPSNTPNDPPPSDPTPPGATANVAASSVGDGYSGRVRSFVPSSVSVTVDGQVTFSNPTDETHNIAITGQAASATLQPGESHAETFPTAGTFQFSCTLHAGMNGTVTVVQ